jgi:redox-sensitive bicupin YhaK (pirin superfamily)
MEIMTYVLEGALRHQDSMGNGSVIRPGEVQIMSAGTGVFHSEQNDSKAEAVHLLQIWLHPSRRGLPPRYDQRALDRAQLRGRLLPIAAPPGQDAVVPVFQDAVIYATVLDRGMAVEHLLRPGRGAYVHVARGAMQVADRQLTAGDAAWIEAGASVLLRGTDNDSEALLFDLL